MEISDAEVVAWAESLHAHGHATMPGVFTSAEVAGLADGLDQLFAEEASIAEERGWLTNAYLVSYCLPAKLPQFVELGTHPGLLRLARVAVGDSCVLSSMNGFTTRPGGTAQRMHVDQDVGSGATLIGVNLVVVLDDFTEATGATRLVPGSHLWGLRTLDPATIEKQATPVEASAGSVVGFASSLRHASGANRTTRRRRSIHAYYAPEWVTPHWDFRASLPTEVARSLDAEQRRVFGIDSTARRYDRRTDTVTRRVDDAR